MTGKSGLGARERTYLEPFSFRCSLWMLRLDVRAFRSRLLAPKGAIAVSSSTFGALCVSGKVCVLCKNDFHWMFAKSVQCAKV